ncbi:DUF4178 domain-containing protein [Formivibrio citricus]|nr:DUF4178 domain-containing protein [Formivibrio citricus]
MKKAQCPSCGAEVIFQSATSVMAVCDYCRSTLVRHDQNIEDIGKMAALAEDASPLHRGVSGAWQGVNFTLIGRIQLQYEAGYWNEWYALFDDGREGWVSEGSGLAYVTFPVEAKGALPEWATLEPGQIVRLGGKSYTLTNKEESRVVASEGELPFRVGAGYPAPAADFRGEDEGFVSIDYSDTPPRLYLGAVTSYAALKLDDSMAAAREAARVQAKVFNCPTCAAPAEIHAGEILAYACPACGTTVDVSDPGLAIIAGARKSERVLPRIPLGTALTLRGDKLQVLGFMRRQTAVDGEIYPWDEYLLYGDKAGFRWLIDSEGHWSYGRATSKLPNASGGKDFVSPVAGYEGQTYKHFQSCRARAAYVAGEFNWRVKAGDEVDCDDYIAPPYMLSKERAPNEITWTQCEYLPLDELKAACPKVLAGPQNGIAPNQPSPYMGNTARFWKVYGLAALLAVALQIFFVWRAANETVLSHAFELTPGRSATYTSAPFVLKRHTNLRLENEASLNNSWAYLSMTLINRTTGEQIALGRELSFYSGRDSDGSWTEGSRHDAAFLTGIPPGEYVMEVETESAPEQKGSVVNRLRVVRDVPVWGNLWVLVFGLLIFPLWASWRRYYFEVQRWAESDHPWGGKSDD